MKGVVVLFVMGAALALGGQTVVPVEQEPQHHPAFENAEIRILNVVLPPGYVSLFHTHSLDNVSVRLTSGTMRTDTLAETGTPAAAPAGRISFYSASPPYTHRVVNVGSDTMRILDVELLGGTAPVMAPARDDLDRHMPVVENGRVRVLRVTLEPGASLPAHEHRRGWLEVEIVGPSAGRYLWHDAGVDAPALAAGSAPIEIVEIEPK